jgi:sugar phosphate isomerase/epimerase
MKFSLVVSLQPTSFEALVRGKVDQTLKELSEMGYEGVELALANPSEINQNKVLKMVKQYGLEVPAIGTGQAYLRDGLSFLNPNQTIRKKAVERIKRHVDFASLFEAQVIIGLIRGKRNKLSEAQATNFFIKSIQECADYASDQRITLAIEPINRYETDFINQVKQAINVLRLIESKNVGVLIDTFHMNIEERSIEESIKLSKPFLSHVHLADSNRQAPGYGHLNFESIIKTLKKISYQKYLSAEILPLPDQFKAAQQTISLLKKIL